MTFQHGFVLEHLSKARTHAPMVVELGKAKIFEGLATEVGFCLLHGKLPRLNLFKYFFGI